MFFKEILKEDDIQDKIIFFGDSPNDEPMFAFFKNSCAVANIQPFINSLKKLPAYITERESGKGFAEAIEFLIHINKVKQA